MISWLRKYDILNKSLCILAAMLLWFYVVSVQNPEKTIEVKNVKVSLSGKEALLQDYGLSVIEGDAPTVTIKVSGRREKIASVTPDKIIVKASLESIVSAGVYAIPYQPSVLVDGVTIVGRSPAAVSVKVDKIVSASIPVKVEMKAEAEEGYYIDEETVSPSMVTIKGPQTEIADVSYALLSYTADKKLTKSVEDSFPYILISSDGKEVVSDKIIRENDTVKLTVPVYEYKEIPFTIDLISAPGINSSFAHAEISPASIRVSGDKSVLSAINQITLDPLSLLGKESGSVITLPVVLPNGLKNINGVNGVTVTIRIDGVEGKALRLSEFEVLSTELDKENYAFIVKTDSLDVQIKGQNDIVNGIEDSMLTAVADLRGLELTPGTVIKAPVDILVSGNPDVGIVGEYFVDVEVVSR